MKMTSEELAKGLTKVVAKAWADEAFKARLLADPAATLTAEGLPPPPGLTVNVAENTDEVFHVVLPNKPTDLSDAELDRVAGGAGNCCIPSCAYPPPNIDHTKIF